MAEVSSVAEGQNSLSFSIYRQLRCELRAFQAFSWERRHLWNYLLALGFNPENYHRSFFLGANMFDKPNKSAFRITVIFLFTKLDKSRAAKTFPEIYPGAIVTDFAFRKECCKWLKDISKENEIHFPEVTPSSLLSPGGPKFVHLLYQLTRHVVTEDMKTNSIGIGIPFAEAEKLRPMDADIAYARRRVAYNKLVKIFQKEDFIIQEYEKKAQLLIKEIQEMKSKYAFLQVLSQKMKESNHNKGDKTERIQKVRSMWTLIMEMLTSLKKEKEVVDSLLVLRDGCGQYILDGSNDFRIPQLLIHRVENDIHNLFTGNLYEDEKLNFLTVIRLLNEALRTLREEHCLSELNKLPAIENKIKPCKESLEHCIAKRLEIEQRRCVPRSGKQEDWELKWKSFLGMCPFNLLFDQDPVLDCLRASEPHSFNVAEYGDVSDFCQHLLPVSDVFHSIHEVHYEKDGESETVRNESTPSPKRIYPVSLELSKASENREVLSEKSLPIGACKYEKKPVLPKILKNEKDESATSEMQSNTGDNVIQTEPPVKREDPLEKARDDLAEEVAKAVMSQSPQSTDEKIMALEDLIGSLAVDPFLARKQIPRTPENLLTEIRSSWRKAVEPEDSSDLELTPTQSTPEKSPVDAKLKMQNTSHSRFMCSIPPPFPVPGFVSSLSENKSQLSSVALKPKKLLSPIIESPDLETPEMQESERIEAQELTCIVSNKSSTEDPEEKNFQYVKILTTPDTCSENNSKTNVLPSDHFQCSLMDGMPHWNLSSLCSIMAEDGCSGILDETLPEELYSTDLSRSTYSETNSFVTESACITDGSENEAVTKPNLKMCSPFNTYKVLKQTECRSEDEFHQTYKGAEFVSSRSNPSLATEESKTDELNGSLKFFCLDEEFTKMPLPEFLNERKYSLSSVRVSCQNLEEMASMTHDIPFDLIQKLKEKVVE